MVEHSEREEYHGLQSAAIDPFFGKESLLAKEICRRHGIPYVTIDSELWLAIWKDGSADSGSPKSICARLTR